MRRSEQPLGAAATTRHRGHLRPARPTRPFGGGPTRLGGVRSTRRPLAHPRWTPPPRNPCWHARVRRARGRSEARVGPTHAVPPPGLERAPPRLIPGEDDRCFLLLAVASPLIPEGGCATPAAPLLSPPCPEGP